MGKTGQKKANGQGGVKDATFLETDFEIDLKL